MDEIKKDLSEVKAQLNALTELCLRIEKSCIIVEEHAGFVENIYTKVRAPLNFLKRQVAFISGEVEDDMPLSLKGSEHPRLLQN